MNIEDGVKAVSNPEKNLKKKTTLRLAVKLADQTPPFPPPLEGPEFSKFSITFLVHFIIAPRN